ncbi:hypothetical protein DM01DRAFT_1379361 [Hesseltinella vesiculosa]|uniref:SEC7 domain-containing protein n=1 Tax=Hesseltinella vesiculosa TaxID=101127 RepID=A0A1X2GYK2_9FUNG|nr:hypothetical protein DM01DRAFT_1379361 [Hesseltinella vesiculosa]
MNANQSANLHTHAFERRYSRRPKWRSVRLAINDGQGPNSTLEPPRSPTSIHTVDHKRSRLSQWLSQQFDQFQRQSHVSASQADDHDTATLASVSVVSHVSSVYEGRKRSSSSPASPTAQMLYQNFTMGDSSLDPIGPVRGEDRQIDPSLLPPTSPAMASSFDGDPYMTDLVHPPTIPLKSAGRQRSAPTDNTMLMALENRPPQQASLSPSPTTSLAPPLPKLALTPADSSDSDDDTFETASAAHSSNVDEEDGVADQTDDTQRFHSLDFVRHVYDDDDDDAPQEDDGLDQLLDEVNDNSSASVYYRDGLDDHGTTAESLFVDYLEELHQQGHGELYVHGSVSDHHLGLPSNPVLRVMDPEVSQALLDWRRKSLLKIDWVNLFSVNTDLWRHSTVFPMLPPTEDAKHISIATSIISLDFKSVPMDKAFRFGCAVRSKCVGLIPSFFYRAYSTRVDYGRASVEEIDQALQMFAQLYWESNPSRLFGCAEVVFVVIHQLLKLNTDIHVGQDCLTMEEFCKETIEFIINKYSSFPIMISQDDTQVTWREGMDNMLKMLYKSVMRKSLVSLDEALENTYLSPQQATKGKKHVAVPRQFQPSTSKQQAPDPTKPLLRTSSLPIPQTAPDPPTRQAKSKLPFRNNHLAPGSWTKVKRRDTYRTKVGPYKEGPLSCQWNREDWKACWVILHQGYLKIYYRDLHASLGQPMRPPDPTAAGSLHSDKKKKKIFMLHNSSHDQVKKVPYQEVDIYLGNTLCEKLDTHSLILQLANGNTYLFDCGSEPQVDVWVRVCNYWAACETKIVTKHSGHEDVCTLWKRPPPPAGSSLLDKKEQQQAIDQHLTVLQQDLSYHLLQQLSQWPLGNWHEKKMYLELEVKKYQAYQQVIDEQ